MQVLREGIELARVAEISQLDIAGVREYVSGLQVAVNDPKLVVVQVAERFQDLLCGAFYETFV